MAILEFGEYWDTPTFFLLLGISVMVVFFCNAGLRQKQRLSLELFPYHKVTLPPLMLVLAGGILFFFYGFRSINVGADTETYVQWFLDLVRFVPEPLENYLLLRVTEPLYTVFTFLCRQLTDNYTVYFCIIGVFLAYSIIRFINDFYGESSDVSSMLFLLGFVASFRYCWSALRFALSMGWVLLSLCALSKRKYAKAILLTVVSFFFHYTSIVNLVFIFYMIVLEWYEKKRIKPAWMFLVTAAGIAATVVAVSVLASLLSDSKYQSYLGIGGNILGYWALILSVVVSVAVLVVIRPTETPAKITAILCVFNFVLMIAALLSGAYRLTYYYAIARLHIWDYAFTQLKKRVPAHHHPFYKIAAVLGVVFFLLFNLGRNSSSTNFAYEFVWMMQP